jgi:hypothetical protein
VFDLANYTPPGKVLGSIFGSQPQGNVSNIVCASILLDTTGPKLVVKAKTSVNVHKPISFDATQSSDPSPGSGVDAGSAVWRFGDGQLASGLAVTHRYAKAGKYTVSFSMKDNAGNETTIKINVEVMAPNAPVSGATVTTTAAPSHHPPVAAAAARITRDPARPGKPEAPQPRACDRGRPRQRREHLDDADRRHHRGMKRIRAPQLGASPKACSTGRADARGITLMPRAANRQGWPVPHSTGHHPAALRA